MAREEGQRLYQERERLARRNKRQKRRDGIVIRQNKSSKVPRSFFWDTGIRNALLKDFTLSDYRNDRGALWENYIVSELAKRNLLAGQPNNLYFWRTRDGAAVDLLIKGTNTFKAYEIKWLA